MEEGLFKSPKELEVQASLALDRCSRKKDCKCKVLWHMVLVKEVLLLVNCSSWLS